MFGKIDLYFFGSTLGRLIKALCTCFMMAAIFTGAPLFFAESAYAADKPPVLLFASAKSGPNDGWPGMSDTGAAITVWGRNLDTFKAGSSLTVCGVELDSAADFTEWGATTSPKTPRNISRITFHLTSAMSGSGGIEALVDGQASNTLPFSITATGSIYIYPDQSAINGWSDVDSALDSMDPGDFLYFRAGTYAFSEYIGYRLDEQNGTDSERITMTSYPGENPTIGPGYLRVHSQYWTFANLHLEGFTFQIGGQRDFCTDGITRHGLRVVGNEFSGLRNIVIQAFGHDFDILGNYVNVSPVDETSYPFYLCSGDNRNVSFNEIHGGSRWAMHVYDEDRPSCEDQGRVLSGWTIEGNIMDATDVGSGFRGALIIQANNVARVNNITVKNNVLYADGTIPTEAMIRIRHHVDGVRIYNNTIYGGLVGVVVTDDLPDNTVIKNNIFYNISGNEIKNDGTAGAVAAENNLYESSPDLTGVSDSSPLVGQADFIDPGKSDFRIGADSDAIDSGVVLSEVPVDFEGLPRPQRSGYDIGAHEYVDGAVDPGGDGGSSNGNSPGGGDGGGGGCFVQALGLPMMTQLK